MIPKTLDRDQVREVDRRAIEDYGLSGLVLMENAGRGVADVLCRLGIAGPVVICCGKGNNGGDGFVTARTWTFAATRSACWSGPRRTSLAAMRASISRSCASAGCPWRSSPQNTSGTSGGGAGRCGLDRRCAVGHRRRGEPRPPLDRVIDQLNAAPPPRLAVDLPSGLDCDTGQPARHTVRAQHTCTFVAAKPGFSIPGAEQYTGEIHVLDIGAPRKLTEEMGNGRTADDGR